MIVCRRRPRSMKKPFNMPFPRPKSKSRLKVNAQKEKKLLCEYKIILNNLSNSKEDRIKRQQILKIINQIKSDIFCLERSNNVSTCSHN
jgi:hypothetical protein